VLEAALALASQVGLDGLSFGVLARQAGLSKSGLFAHFESREDLQRQVLGLAAQRFTDRVLRPAVAQPAGLRRLRRFFEGWIEWIHADTVPGGDVLISAAFEFDDAPEGPLRDAVVEGHHLMSGTVERLARNAVRAGDLARGTDVAQLAFEFLGIVHAYHHVRRLLRDESEAARARAAFERLLAHYAAGRRAARRRR
jgi:AcrR family transcriptional regulator